MRGYNWFGDGLCSFGYGGYFSIWHYLVLIGLVVLVVGIVVMRKKSHGSENSIEMLKRMYVNGELTEEEYLKRKSVIERK